MISNPNDLAYVSILFCVTVALATRGWGMRGERLLVLGATFFTALLNIVLSASRSGLVGLFAGSVFYVLSGRQSMVRKVVFICLLIVAACAGWIYNQLFQERLVAVYNERHLESNLMVRFQAQRIALLAGMENPLGVGVANFPQATAHLVGSASFSVVTGSDSIYVDTLLGAGFVGLALLLYCFYRCWQIGRELEKVSPEDSIIYKSGLVAVFLFGAATASPASIFVAPAFFLMVGTAFLILHSASRWA